MSRRNQILAALLAVQLAVAALVFWPRSSGMAAASALLPDLSADQLTGLTVESSEDEPVVMRKQESGWVLPEAGGYPVEASRVEELVTKLAGVRGDRVVANNASSHERLRVGDAAFERKITLEMADGSSRTLYVGTAPGAGAVHVRLGDGDTVYMARNLNVYDIGAAVSAWINPTYFSAPVDAMQSVRLENSAGAIDFTRNTTGTWGLADAAAGETFNTGAFVTTQNRLSDLRMVRPIGTEQKPEYGLDQPSATVTVTSQAEGESEPQTNTILVGAKIADGASYYVKASNSDYVVEVAAASVEPWTTQTRQDYLQAPPTPALDAFPTVPFSSGEAAPAAATPAQPAPGAEAAPPAESPLPTPKD